jgi:HAE1 family hydrophobic/amphiphilic exporter-1
MKKIAFPSDFSWEIGGTAESQQESFMYLGIAMIVAIFLVYMVMASQFESLLDPFIIMFTIPLAMIGAIWMLFITGTTMSVTGLIGCVILVGIVVNNALYSSITSTKCAKNMAWIYGLLFSQRQTSDAPGSDDGFDHDFRYDTAFLKLGSGSEIWVPLGRAVIGGLSFATVFTLILVPIIYLFFEQLSLKRAIKKHKIEMRPIGRPENFDISFIK